MLFVYTNLVPDLVHCATFLLLHDVGFDFSFECNQIDPYHFIARWITFQNVLVCLLQPISYRKWLYDYMYVLLLLMIA